MKPASAHPLAPMRGTLELREGCLWMTTSDGRSWLVLWPNGSRIVQTADGVAVFDGTGKAIATVGKTMQVTGGETHDLGAVTTNVGQEPPSQCRTGLGYWLASEVRTVDGDR
jgi:hypothetical protein